MFNLGVGTMRYKLSGKQFNKTYKVCLLEIYSKSFKMKAKIHAQRW